MSTTRIHYSTPSGAYYNSATRRYRRTLFCFLFSSFSSFNSFDSFNSISFSIQAIIHRSAAPRSTIHQTFTFTFDLLSFPSTSHFSTQHPTTAAYRSTVTITQPPLHSTKKHQKNTNRQCHSTIQTHFYPVHDFDSLIPLFHLFIFDKKPGLIPSESLY